MLPHTPAGQPSIFTALQMLVVVACSSPDVVVTKRPDDGVVSYPFTPDGYLAAVSSGDQLAVKTFLERGMDVNGTDAYGNTGLHAASDEEDYLTVRFLIEAGADSNLQNDEGNTPLLLAVANNDPDILAVLLKASAHPSFLHAAGESAADIAGRLGHTEALQLLLFLP